MVIILVIKGWGFFEGCYLPKKLMNWHVLIDKIWIAKVKVIQTRRKRIEQAA